MRLAKPVLQHQQLLLLILTAYFCATSVQTFVMNALVQRGVAQCRLEAPDDPGTQRLRRSSQYDPGATCAS